eukprot:1141907-Pelagomonas_calceolata.AAC.1
MALLLSKHRLTSKQQRGDVDAYSGIHMDAYVHGQPIYMSRSLFDCVHISICPVLTVLQACSTAAAPSRHLVGPVLRKSAMVVRGSILSRALQAEEPHSQVRESGKVPAQPQAGLQQHQEGNKANLGNDSANGAPRSNLPAVPFDFSSANANNSGMPTWVPIETGSQ